MPLVGDFQGYSPLVSNFAQLPIEVVHDEEMPAQDHHTLVVLASLIAYEQFARGIGRKEPVPLAWHYISRHLRLSEDAAKDRVSTLEASGRIRILEGPRMMVSGRLMDGPNLFVLRWMDESPTDRLKARVARRLKNRERMSNLNKSRVEGVRQHTPSTHPLTSQGGALTHPLTDSPEHTPSETQRTPSPGDAYNTPPSIRPTELTDTEILKNQSVRQSSNGTDRQTDWDPSELKGWTSWTKQEDPTPWPSPVHEALGRLLDPPQLAQVESRSPWSQEGAWAILQGLKAKGKNLRNPAGVLWNALLLPPKGSAWIGKVGSALRDAGWRQVPEDGTHRQDWTRERNAAALSREGLERLPLFGEELEKHRQLVREAEAQRRASQALLLEDSDEDSFLADEELEEPSGPPPAPPAKVWTLPELPGPTQADLRAAVETYYEKHKAAFLGAPLVREEASRLMAEAHQRIKTLLGDFLPFEFPSDGFSSEVLKDLDQILNKHLLALRKALT